MTKFLQNIFSITNEEDGKLIRLLGLRIRHGKRSFKKLERKLEEMCRLQECLIDVKSVSKASGFLRIVQSIDFGILCKVDEICRKHGISYWLDGGTLLGSIRHEGFIPWDDDLDIAMMASDYERFQTVVDEEFKGTDFVFKQVPSHIGKILHKDFLPQTEEEWIDFTNWEKNERLYLGVDIFPFYYCKNGLSDNQIADKMRENYATKELLYKRSGKNYSEYYDINDFVNKKNSELSSKEITSRVFLGNETIAPEARIFRTNDIFPLTKYVFEGKKFFVPQNYKNILMEYYDDYEKIKIYPSHLDFEKVCKEDKYKLLEHLTIEEKYGKDMLCQK